MTTFPHWRNVGRAMRWARQQQGVTVEMPTPKILIRSRVYRGPDDVIVKVNTLPSSTWFETYTGIVGSAKVNPNNAAEALRVLAALDLIPADLAYGPDERYGRCVKCDRLAQWWPAEAGAEDRWVHVIKGHERFIDYPNHRAEVAE
jgi:hypothetical protein